MSSVNESPVIIGFVRTPHGKFGGSIKALNAPRLSAECMKSLIRRLDFDVKLIDEVIIGCSIQGGHGQNVARAAAIMAGLPPTVNAYTVNRVCSSGMQAIINAVHELKLGEASFVIAGGVESMSTAPLALPPELRWGVRHCILRSLNLIDLMVNDGLLDSIEMKLMGQQADVIARMHNVKREELDEYAYRSHVRAAHATENKLFIEMEPVDTYANGERVYLDHDECIRFDTSLDNLAKLKPVFTPEGPHTAGTSSQLSDGAAMLMLTSESKAKEFGFKPVARVVGYAHVSVETWRFPEAPVYVIEKLLRRLGWTIDDVDAFEVNEAFAVVPVLASKLLKVPLEKMNILGGAIALGHPLGATGARIVTTLISALKHVGGRRGVAALCHGGGGATAIAIELL